MIHQERVILYDNNEGMLTKAKQDLLDARTMKSKVSVSNIVPIPARAKASSK